MINLNNIPTVFCRDARPVRPKLSGLINWTQNKSATLNVIQANPQASVVL